MTKLQNVFCSHAPDTETTLFQVASRVGQAQLNGKTLLTSSSHELKAGDSLISPNGHGYLMLEAGELGVHLGAQVSKHNKTMSETRGDFSTAWLNHGKAPSSGHYGYVLFPKTAAETVSMMKNRMNGEGAFYQILRKDRYAHIIKDVDSDLTAMAVYKSSPDPVGPVKSVDQDGLLIFKQSKDQLMVSVAHPDLNWNDEGISQVTTFKFILTGAWEVMDASEGVKCEALGDDTEVILSLKDGLSQHVNFRGIP